MKVKMFYDNGHFDIFDTDSLVYKVFKGNVVTDYSFDLTERDGAELWGLLLHAAHNCALRLPLESIGSGGLD